MKRYISLSRLQAQSLLETGNNARDEDVEGVICIYHYLCLFQRYVGVLYIDYYRHYSISCYG